MGLTKKKRETKNSEGLAQLLLNVETVNVKIKLVDKSRGQLDK